MCTPAYTYTYLHPPDRQSASLHLVKNCLSASHTFRVIVQINLQLLESSFSTAIGGCLHHRICNTMHAVHGRVSAFRLVELTALVLHCYLQHCLEDDCTQGVICPAVQGLRIVSIINVISSNIVITMSMAITRSYFTSLMVLFMLL